jgi:site-specific DNA-methyltransferase (cytosine-N4-specific)
MFVLLSSNEAFLSVAARNWSTMAGQSELRRVLRPRGSLVLEIGGAWNRGQPTRSIYYFELLARVVNEAKFHLAEEVIRTW